MAYTELEKRNILINAGYDPDRYEVDEVFHSIVPKTQITYSNSTIPENTSGLIKQQYGAAETFARNAALSAGPALVGLGAASATGAGIGALVGGPFAPITATAGAVIGGIAGSYGASKLQEKIIPQEYYQKAAEASVQHPVAGFAGGVAPNAIAFNPVKSLAALPKVGSGLGKVTRLGANAGGKVSPGELNAMVNLGANLGVSGGMNIAQQLSDDQPFSYGSLAADLATAPFFLEPTMIGRKVFRFEPTLGIDERLTRAGKVLKPGELKPPVSTISSDKPTYFKALSSMMEGGWKPSEINKLDLKQVYNYAENKVPRKEVNLETKQPYTPLEKVQQNMLATGEGAKVDIENQRIQEQIVKLQEENLKLKQKQQELQTKQISAEIEQQMKDTISQQVEVGKQIQQLKTSKKTKPELPFPEVKQPKQPPEIPTAPKTSEQSALEEAAKAKDLRYTKSPFPLVEQAEQAKALRSGVNISRDTAPLQGSQGKARYVSPEENPLAGEQGTAVVGPDATVGMLSHEAGFHGKMRQFKNSTDPKDRQLYMEAMEVGKMLADDPKFLSSVSEAGRRIPEMKARKESPELIAEEAAAIAAERENFGHEHTKAYGKKYDKIKQWWSNVKNEWKYSLGGKANIIQHVGQRYRYDAPYGTRPEVLPVAKQTTEKGDTTNAEKVQGKEGEIKLSESSALLDREPYIREAAEANAEQFKAPQFRAFTTKVQEIGKRLSSDDIPEIESLRLRATDQFKQAINEGKLEEAAVLSSKPQFFSELKEAIQDKPKLAEESALTNDDIKQPFITVSEREFTKDRPFGLTPDKYGHLPTQSVRAKLEKSLPKAEYQILKEAGIDELLKGKDKVYLKDLSKFIRENGPKVEVVKYRADENTDKARNKLLVDAEREYNAAIHTIESLGYKKYEEEGLLFGALEEINTKKVLSSSGDQVYEYQIKAGEEPDYIGQQPLRQYPPEIQKYFETKAKYERIGRQEPDKVAVKSATARFESVNPKQLTDMEGAVDILVKIPQAEVEKEGARKGIPIYNKFSEGIHYPHDKNVVGFGRGYFETLPDGKKVFHVFEVQSDWAQKRRKRDLDIQKYAKENITLSKEENNLKYWKSDEYADIEVIAKDEVEAAEKIWNRVTEKISNDPLLAYNESLVLKQAIKHAIDNGADYIAISDPETAMLTEGHDAVAGMLKKVKPKEVLEYFNSNKEFVKQHYGDDWKDGVYIHGIPTGNLSIIRIDKPDSNLFSVEYARAIASEYPNGEGLSYEGETPYIKQEKGMRLHYGETLPNIASKLTGEKGERVSFGEHRNAFETTTGGRPLIRVEDGANISKQRQNLIFKNPDGTPKTDASALMFPLDKISPRVKSGEPFTFTGAKYAEESSLEGSSSTDIPEIDPSRKAFFKSWASQIDKIRPLDNIVADAAYKNAAQREIYEGEFFDLQSRIGDLRPSRNEMDRVVEWMRAKTRSLDEPFSLTAKEQTIADSINQQMRSFRERANKLGMKVEDSSGNLREGEISDYYIPDMLSSDALYMFTHKSTSPQAKAAVKEWIDYVVSESARIGKRPLTEEEVTKNINEYLRAIGGTKYHNVDFPALRRAQGYGLPESLREKSLGQILFKYGRRASNDLAFFQHIQSQPRIAWPLGVSRPEGGNYQVKDHPELKDVTSLTSTPEVQGLLKFLYNDFSSLANPRLMSAVRMLTNGILGPGTEIRNIAQLPGLFSPYMNGIKDVQAITKALTNIRDHYRDSLRYGARKPTIDYDRIRMLYSPDKVVKAFNYVADKLRLFQGREHGEQFERALSFGVGKELARMRIVEHLAGDKKATKFLEDFGTLADLKRLSEEDLNIIGKNFADRTQGTYDERGLPAGAFDSQLAPLIALSRWGVEKSNVIFKDVIAPLKQGNYAPLLAYTLGTFASGAAIKQLNEWMTGHKDYTPNFKETLEKGDIADKAAYIVNLAQLGSFAGILSDLAKVTSDIGIQHEKPRGPINFPLADLITDTIPQNLTDWSQAISSGADPLETTGAMILELIKANIQGVRIANSKFVNAEDTERSNKFRDVRVFKKLEDEEVPPLSSYRSNKLMDRETRNFKRTADIGEAAGMLPQLLRKAIEDSKGSPYKLKMELRSLKQNNYQTMPNPETLPDSFAKYYSFLAKTQGAEEASKRLADYLLQNQVNRQKSEMIPTL